VSIPNLHSAVPAGDESGGPEARGVARAVKRLQLITSPPPVDIEAVLSDMTLSDRVREALAPMATHGFRLIDDSVESPFDGYERLVTLMSRLDETYYLVEFPAALMRSGVGDSQSVCTRLQNVFPRASRLFILGYEVDALPLNLVNIIEKYDWVEARFVPWLHIAGPPGDAPPQSQSILPAAFGLSRNQRGTRRNVPQDGLEPVVERFRNYLGSSGADARASYNDFVTSLGLPTRAQRHWDADVTVTARAFVRWVADEQGPAMLGKVVAALIDEAPGNALAPQLLDIVTAYGLLTGDRLDRLRRRISEVAG
jgi:hypothetical protein